MQVQMGIVSPHPHHLPDGHDGSPCVFYWSVHDSGAYTQGYGERPHGKDALIHVLSNPVSHLPEYEAFVSVTAAWLAYSPDPPTWVWSDDFGLAEMLSEAYSCPIGIPEDVEETHHTMGGPPGVGGVSEIAS